MDQKRVEEIYRIIEGLHIELEPDPTVLGPRYIMERVSKCRNNLNIVSQIRQSISRERRELKRQLSGEESIMTIERDQLLASNETVRKQPNIRDREAVVNTMLRERLNRISQLKADILDIDTVEQPVKMVHDELVRTATEIRTQRSMIQADRTSGAGYGDESGDAPQSRVPREDDLDEEELDRIMREQTPLVAPEPSRTPPKPKEPEPKPEVEETPCVSPETCGAFCTGECLKPAPVEETAASEVPSVEPPKAPETPTQDKQEPSGIDLHTEVPLSALALPKPEVVEPPVQAGEDPDIAKFLAKEEPAPQPKAKATKKAKAEPPPAPVEDDAIDFESLLQSL